MTVGLFFFFNMCVNYFVTFYRKYAFSLFLLCAKAVSSYINVRAYGTPKNFFKISVDKTIKLYYILITVIVIIIILIPVLI